MNTSITRLLNVRTPIIAASMAGASGGALAAQVTLAGGFGFMAAGYEDVAVFRKELQAARSIFMNDRRAQRLLKSEATNDGQDEPLLIGVGFIGWTLDESDGRAEELLSIALEEPVSAVWLAFGTDLGKWVHHIRSVDSNRSKPHKTLVFVLVNTIQEAKVAVDEWDVDVLVVQGIESGGHGLGTALPLLPLVAEILNAYSPAKGVKPCPPILAAGGLVTGASVAALLTLGASGAALGTRFLLTPEAQYTDAQKAALITADGTSTVRTIAFDVMRGTTEWPKGINGRALKNKTVVRFDKGENLEDLRKFFQKATQEGDAEGMLVWAGDGIGLVNEIKPAADVIAELHDEMIERLKATATLISFP